MRFLFSDPFGRVRAAASGAHRAFRCNSRPPFVCIRSKAAALPFAITPSASHFRFNPSFALSRLQTKTGAVKGSRINSHFIRSSRLSGEIRRRGINLTIRFRIKKRAQRSRKRVRRPQRAAGRLPRRQARADRARRAPAGAGRPSSEGADGEAGTPKNKNFTGFSGKP